MTNKKFDEDIDWESIRVDNSKPPLRWIANWFGSIASYGILEVSYLEENNKTNTLKYKFYEFLWSTFWPIYDKYGTFYSIDGNYFNRGWDFVDEETGDAFKVINYDK